MLIKTIESLNPSIKILSILVKQSKNGVNMAFINFNSFNTANQFLDGSYDE